MNEDFIFRLGADVSSFTKSITEVEKELDSARKAIKGALGDDLVKGNQYVQDLEQSLKNLRSVGVQVPGAKEAATEIKNIAPAAQKAQNTLTGLSGVVRDLPFGFIAIQNNLPILIDQFSALSKTSGGVGGAIKNLAGALVGPAGAAFAFGAVVSVVTGVIQKYGSLGNAIKVLTADNAALVEAQLQFVKESTKAAGASVVEESKVRILTKALLDGKTPRKDQIAYYEELKRISPDVVSGISEENLGTDESNRLISQNVLLRAELVKLQIQEAGIKAAASTNAEALAIARNKETKATKDLANFTAEYNAVSKASGQAPRALQGSATSIKAANAALQSAQKEIKQLVVVENEFLGQLDKITPRVAEINGIFKEQNDELKKSNEETKNATNESKKRQAQLERETKALEKKILAERQARSLRVPVQVSFDIAEIGKQNLGELYKKNVIDKFKAQLDKSGAIQVPLNLPKINTEEILRQLIELQNATKERREAITKEFNLTAATELFKSTFFNPVQNLFSDLLSGADNAFKAFTKAVLSAINQIVAKIIATGIISLLANLISGGTAGLGKAVLGDIGKAFGFSFGGIANPNFGGVTGGGMAMSGAVNVVLRGQDLVGSLNRTNAQISRVG